MCWSVDVLVSPVGDVYHSDELVCRELVQMALAVIEEGGKPWIFFRGFPPS